MEYKYKHYIDKKNIVFLGDDNYTNIRYLLEIPLRNTSKKSVLVILKNPSAANQYKSDHTINNVLKYCHSQGYGKVYIMNLYAYYSTKPKGIADLIKSGNESIAIGQENDHILKRTLQKVEDVILAWGGNTFGCTTHYKNRIKEVTKIVKEKNLYYVEGISKCGWYPRHGQVWSVNSDVKIKSWQQSFL